MITSVATSVPAPAAAAPSSLPQVAHVDVAMRADEPLFLAGPLANPDGYATIGAAVRDARDAIRTRFTSAGVVERDGRFLVHELQQAVWEDQLISRRVAAHDGADLRPVMDHDVYFFDKRVGQPDRATHSGDLRIDSPELKAIVCSAGAFLDGKLVPVDEVR